MRPLKMFDITERDQYTVNIFSDASFKNGNRGSFGAISIYRGDRLAESVKDYQTNGQSVNSLEIRGIMEAINLAFYARRHVYDKYQFDQINAINIFSDSSYAVSAIKNYLFNPQSWDWNYEDKCYYKKKKPIPNQNLIIEASNMIWKYNQIYYGYPFGLFWCPAHIYKNNQLPKALRQFKRINCKGCDEIISLDYMRKVCISNDKIDRMVQDTAQNRDTSKTVYTPIEFYYGP